MIQTQYVKEVSARTHLPATKVEKVLGLLAEGATIPFIARYRKDTTGGMDEVAIQTVNACWAEVQLLEKRKEFVLKSIREQGKLTENLHKDIVACTSLTALEDLYLPYKQKRSTRAEKARNLGLEPLAKILMRQQNIDVLDAAKRFVWGDVKDTGEALRGARDIMAEWMNERIAVRDKLRSMFKRSSVIEAKITKKAKDLLEENGRPAKEVNKYRDYFDFTEPASRSKSHRLLALFRAEKEGYLRLRIAPDEDHAIRWMHRYFCKGYSQATEQVELAAIDAYKRLLRPTLETEWRKTLKERADKVAIEVFAGNLRELMLAPPVGEKRILAIDPGFRTGCKVVCLSEKGDFLKYQTIFPHPPQSRIVEAKDQIQALVNQYAIQAIGIGNGTAGRETQSFVTSIAFGKEIPVYMVNEDGASIYSASEVAREEFPDLDVTVRGAISIGRRLMDPLSELVKIDPKSIGVGQYQHDVDQKMLRNTLDFVVRSCVNSVGVDVNTASKYLLTYVSGLGPTLAENIIRYRTEHGSFSSRNDLKKVPRMGAKAFQQCIGFLRVKNERNPLDNSAVHPENYEVVRQMAKDLGTTVNQLVGNPDKVNNIESSKYEQQVGKHTLTDILEELGKPGRDPRSSAELFQFDQTIHVIYDLHPGLILPAIVTNVTNFGAFVDIGIKQNGLIHISNLSGTFVDDPSKIVRVNQKIKVEVLEVDIPRSRIALRLVEK